MKIEKYKILGYSNPIACHSVPLTTIILRDIAICALFPDLTINKLNIDDVNKLEDLESYIPEKKDKRIGANEYSYFTYHGEIITDTPINMITKMELDLEHLVNGKVHHEMLEELIVTEILNAKKNNVDFVIHELLKLEKKFKRLRFFTTTRIKNNKERAKRIFLQHEKNGSVKTDYKKNLYSNNALTDQDIRRFSKGLNNSLLNLSKRYKNELIANYILDDVAWSAA